MSTMTGSGAAVALFNAPWQLATLIIVGGLVSGVVQAVWPQDSDDRAKVLGHLIRHAQFKRLHRLRILETTLALEPSQPVVIDTEVITPTAIEAARVNPAAKARRSLGAQLKIHRMARMMTISYAAGAIDCSHSKLSRLEAGSVTPKRTDIDRLARLYEATPRARRIWHTLIKEAQPPGKGAVAQRGPLRDAS